MTITHITALRNTIVDAVRAVLNAGSGNTTLDLLDGAVVAVTFDLGDTPFGASSGGVSTVAGTPIAATAGASVSGLDNFELKDGDGTVQITGSITASGGGGDIEVTNINVANGQDCSLESMTYEGPQ